MLWELPRDSEMGSLWERTDSIRASTDGREEAREPVKLQTILRQNMEARPCSWFEECYIRHRKGLCGEILLISGLFACARSTVLPHV